MSDYKIGEVISVSGERVFITLLDYDDKSETGVPSTMMVNVLTENGPTPLLIGQPGTFVSIALSSGKLLAMITTIDMKETELLQAEIKNAESEGKILVEGQKRIVSAVPVGTLDAGNRFERGADVLPTVNSSAFAVPPKILNNIYEQYAEGGFSIGRLSLIPGQEAKINLDTFLSRHAAILGQTGGGKSWTVATLLQKIAAFPQATVVLFDLHGEYSSAFGEEADIISGTDIELPYWLMNSEELLGLMVDRSESTAPNQIAKFKELLQEAKNSHPENQGLGLDRITIDTPVYFDFDKILTEFRRLDTEKVEGQRGEKNGPLFGQFTRLLMRVGSRLNDQR